MNAPEHVVCHTADLRILDARLADLARAATLARLPAKPLDASESGRLRIRTDHLDQASAVVVRTCPDTGAALTIARWDHAPDGTGGRIEVEMTDPSRKEVLNIIEPLRIHGPKPDLAGDDAAWFDHIRTILSTHRNRMAIPESERPDTPFDRVVRLASVAARSAQRGRVVEGLRTAGIGDGPGSDFSIAVKPPSPYEPSSLRSATRGPVRARHDLQPASAIRADLATLSPIVSMGILGAGLLNTISIAPYRAHLHPIAPEDRDAMERLRDAAEFAVDRVDLHLPRHPTTLSPDAAGRLEIRNDGSVEEWETKHVAKALRMGANAVGNAVLDHISPGSVMFKGTTCGATFLRTRTVSATECNVEWIVSNGPAPRTEIMLTVILARSDDDGRGTVLDAETIAAELNHLAEGLASTKEASRSVPPGYLTGQVVVAGIASLLDAFRDPDRSISPFDIKIGIDPFGNLDAFMVPVFQSTAIPIASDAQDLAERTGHRTGAGILRRKSGAGLRLEMRPRYANARYVPDDPERSDVMDRLRIESERIAGLLPVLHDRLLAVIA